MDFPTRLRDLRNEKDISQADLGKMFNLSKQTISSYELGGSRPNQETLGKLASFFGVSTDYLLSLTDDRKGKASTIDIVNILEDRQTQLIAAGRPLTPAQRVNLIRAIDQDKPAAPTAQIPIVATIRAGVPILAEEHISGYLDVPGKINADFAVQVTGDSMCWAGVHEGDYVLCRESQAAHTGQMVVAAVQDVEWGGTIKYFVQANGKRILRAANPEYKDIALSPEDRIVGIVVAVLKDNPPALHTYETLVAATTGRGQEWASLAVTAASIGWTPREIEEMLKMMAKVPRQVKE